MKDLVKRKSIRDIYSLKREMLETMYKMYSLQTSLDRKFEELDRHSPVRLDKRFNNFNDNREEKYVDMVCWQYLVDLFELHKYMLCTDYDKLQSQIDNFDFPKFTVENAEGYVASLKDIIYDNVKTMLKEVYDRIINSIYYTGSGYSNRKKKKRNNSGVDSHFIITTNDNYRLGYGHGRPSITDDLEKLCYILDNKSLPDVTLMQTARQDKEESNIVENEYLKIKICKNGNTHFWLSDNIKDKLNLYGSDPSKIGQDIRIKTFEKW